MGQKTVMVCDACGIDDTGGGAGAGNIRLATVRYSEPRARTLADVASNRVITFDAELCDGCRDEVHGMLLAFKKRIGQVESK